MERLTERIGSVVINVKYVTQHETAIHRLAAIEDILGDEYDMDRLREQVEKVWRGEWVKRHKHRGGFRRVKGFDDMGEQHEVTIDERCEYDDLYCSKCGKQSPDNFLNFCGYCGAPMTDEAVEMVMERMEALHENP